MSEISIHPTKARVGDVLDGRPVTEVKALSEKTAITSVLPNGTTIQQVFSNWQMVTVTRDPREILAGASERALREPGAKWTPETGWTDEPMPRATLRAAHYRGEHDAGVTTVPDPVYVPGCPACEETRDADLVDITVTVRVRINPDAAPGEDPTNLAQGIVDQALTLGSDDMERQAREDNDPDDRIGAIFSWTLIR